jgi:APA family basic amino acid/polyamine antiporter
MLTLRKTAPAFPRKFRTPLPWLVGPLAILGCLYLFWSLPLATTVRFLVWNVIGLAIYLLIARHKSVLAVAERGQ